MPAPYPFKPNDWVADLAENVGRVKRVYEDADGVLLDIVMFDRKGNQLGRVSEPCGGPRTFEPACSAEGWRRVKEPDFPMTIKSVKDGDTITLKYWAGPALPSAQWTPPKRRIRYAARLADDKFRKALEQIADGHNDARQLAKEVLCR